MPDTRSISPCAPKLAKSVNLQSGRFKDFVVELTGVVAANRDIDRVVFWMHHPINRTFNVVALHKSDQDVFSKKEVISEDNTPGFYETVKNTFVSKFSRIEDIADLAEIRRSCPTMFPMKSMLMQQVRFEGKLLGLLSFDQIGSTRDWNADDEIELGAAASVVQQAYQTSLTIQREQIGRAHV